MIPCTHDNAPQKGHGYFFFPLTKVFKIIRKAAKVKKLRFKANAQDIGYWPSWPSFVSDIT